VLWTSEEEEAKLRLVLLPCGGDEIVIKDGIETSLKEELRRATPCLDARDSIEFKYIILKSKQYFW
jgi:hypothetical protein